MQNTKREIKSQHTNPKEAKLESKNSTIPPFSQESFGLIGVLFSQANSLLLLLLLFVAADFAGSQIHLFLVGFFAKLQDKKPWLLW
jgi:hypothetical protein